MNGETNSEKAGMYYLFTMKGERYSMHEDYVAFCFPSITRDGSYFFTLHDGDSFRGEQVKEVMVNSASLLRQAFIYS